MRRFEIIALATILSLAGSGAQADPPKAEKAAKREQKQRDHDLARQAVLRHEVLPLPRILTLVNGYQAGEVIEIELKSRRGVVFYDVHVLTAAGVVRELFVDARNGRLIVNQIAGR